MVVSHNPLVAGWSPARSIN